ncbi:DUF6522 family protein [Hoeflea sp.]|jgi:hypothetical protein|uniref:DUF6522 family protein n=1 Tax=Hoeflea sp. TaxID=1940281 RepID=UPI002B000FED|nr:DUF6522 family protein [Hoeflea sp.]
MIKILLTDDRTEVDMDGVARAFGISTNELELRLGAGTITRWSRASESDNKPGMIFSAADREIEVNVNETGNVVNHSAAESARRSRLDALLDEALQGTFPASDPFSLTIDIPRPAVSDAGKADAE